MNAQRHMHAVEIMEDTMPQHPAVTDVRAGYYVLAAQPIRFPIATPNQAYRRAAMLAREYGRPVRMMMRTHDHGPLIVCGGVHL